MMRLPAFLRRPLLLWAGGIMGRRRPDETIQDGPGAPDYLERWHLLPHNRLTNLYLHRFWRSDEDRAPHDHPWPNCSVILFGRYLEWVPIPGSHPSEQKLEGKVRLEGDIVFRRATATHRIDLIQGMDGSAPRPVVSLFLTGPKLREWGFWSRHGWIWWRDFVHPPGGKGLGCDGPARIPGTKEPLR